MPFVRRTSNHACVCAEVQSLSAALQTASEHWDCCFLHHRLSPAASMPWLCFSHQSGQWIPLSATEREERHVQTFFIFKMMELLCCLICSHEQPFFKLLHSFIFVLRQWLPLFNGTTGTWSFWHLFPPILQVLVGPNSCSPFVERSPGSPVSFRSCRRKNQSINLSFSGLPSLMVCQAHYWFSAQNNSALNLFWSIEGVQFFRRQLSSETVMDNKVWGKQNLTHWLFFPGCSSAGPSALAHLPSRHFSSHFLTKHNSRGK